MAARVLGSGDIQIRVADSTADEMFAAFPYGASEFSDPVMDAQMQNVEAEFRGMVAAGETVIIGGAALDAVVLGGAVLGSPAVAVAASDVLAGQSPVVSFAEGYITPTLGIPGTSAGVIASAASNLNSYFGLGLPEISVTDSSIPDLLDALAAALGFSSPPTSVPLPSWNSLIGLDGDNETSAPSASPTSAVPGPAATGNGLEPADQNEDGGDDDGGGGD